MTLGTRARDRLVPLALAGALVVGAGLAASATSDDGLRRDRGFAIATPTDGDEVGARFLLSWAPGAKPAPGGYAVVVDGPLPRPGAEVTAGLRTLLLTATSLRLSIGAATTGSPSARRFHTVQVVRLDADGRRLGEDVAVVHVRARP